MDRRCYTMLAVCALFAAQGGIQAQETTQITVQTAQVRQVFDGLGAGAIFYEGHITSLAARDKNERQQQLYDDMFARVPTRYLQLMIRETHEPQNDNDDPYTPAFDEKNFEYCKPTIQIAKAALKRQPDIQLYATLYTPPPWMKTNNDASGGGEARATLKNGLELELGEYVWAFLRAHAEKRRADPVPEHRQRTRLAAHPAGLFPDPRAERRAVQEGRRIPRQDGEEVPRRAAAQARRAEHAQRAGGRQGVRAAALEECRASIST